MSTPELGAQLRDGRALTLNDSRYFLLEPPHHVLPPRLEDHVFGLQAAGFVPILTHPERLTWLDQHYDLAKRLVYSGVLMQITAGSLTGRFGRRARYWAERMLDEGFCHLLATDAHDPVQRAPLLAEARDHAARRVGAGGGHASRADAAAGHCERREPGRAAAAGRAIAHARARGGALDLAEHHETRSASGSRLMKYRVVILRLVAFMLLAVLLPACASNTGQTTGTAVADAGPGQRSHLGARPTPSPMRPSKPPRAKAADTTAALASTSGQSGDYRIGPRDVLDVSVFQVTDLNKSVQVSEDGSITLPLVGKVPVGGKTTQQTEEMIADLLRKRYMQSPQVSVSLKQYGQRVTVNGEVKTPRVLSVDGKVTLSEAIASAGGLGDLADPKRVHIARKAGNRVQDDVYDLKCDPVRAGYGSGAQRRRYRRRRAIGHAGRVQEHEGSASLRDPREI